MDHVLWYSLLFARILFIIHIDSYSVFGMLDIGVCLKSKFVFISFLENSSNHIENDTFEWCLTLFALLCLLNESIEICHYLLLIYPNPLFNIQQFNIDISDAKGLLFQLLSVDCGFPKIKKKYLFILFFFLFKLNVGLKDESFNFEILLNGSVVWYFAPKSDCCSKCSTFSKSLIIWYMQMEMIFHVKICWTINGSSEVSFYLDQISRCHSVAGKWKYFKICPSNLIRQNAGLRTRLIYVV